jgi:hypothetical protein
MPEELDLDKKLLDTTKPEKPPREGLGFGKKGRKKGKGKGKRW